MARLLARNIPPAVNGLDTTSGPAAVPTGKAPVVDNFLLDQPGKMRMRGGFFGYSTWQLPDNRVCGAWEHNGKLLLGLATTGAVASEPCFAPLAPSSFAVAAGIRLFDPANTSVSALTTISGAVDLDDVPWGKGVRLGSYVYGYSYSSPSTATDDAGSNAPLRQLLRWDGTAAAPTKYANAPRGAQDVAVHLNRLWVLCGTDPSAPASAPVTLNTLYWTDNAGPTSDGLSFWQDDVSGLVNKIVIGDQDPNDYGVALALLNQNLVILKRRSIYVLYGTSPDTFTMRRVTSKVGCIDPRSVVESEEGIYFLSQDGYMFFDGTSFTNLSQQANVDEEISAAIALGLPSSGSSVGNARAVACKLPNNHILLTINLRTASTPFWQTEFCMLLHTTTNSWATVSSDLATEFGPSAVGYSRERAIVFVNRYPILANQLTSPRAVPESSYKHLDVLRLPGGSDPALAGIPARWRSSVEFLSSPVTKAQLHRLIVESSFCIADSAEPGWYVSLTNSEDRALLDEFQVPSQGEDSTFYPRIARSVEDCFAETDDVQVNMEWRSGAEVIPIERAEIYGATVEYQPSRQSHDS